MSTLRQCPVCKHQGTHPGGTIVEGLTSGTQANAYEPEFRVADLTTCTRCGNRWVCNRRTATRAELMSGTNIGGAKVRPTRRYGGAVGRRLPASWKRYGG